MLCLDIYIKFIVILVNNFLTRDFDYIFFYELWLSAAQTARTINEVWSEESASSTTNLVDQSHGSKPPAIVDKCETQKKKSFSTNCEMR